MVSEKKKKRGPCKIKGTPDGWSLGDIFLEWVKQVFIPEVQPLQTPHKCVILLLDGSKTHCWMATKKELKPLKKEVVVFSSHLTDVTQSLDKAVFRSLRNSFHKHGGKWKTLHIHRGPTPTDLVCFWTTVFYETVIAKDIRSGFASCIIYYFRPDHFPVHSAPERIHLDALEVAACACVPSSPASVPSSRGSTMSSSSKSDTNTLCCGRAIN